MSNLSKIVKYLLISFIVLVAIMMLGLVGVVGFVLAYIPFGELIEFIKEFLNTNGANLQQLINTALSEKS